MNDKIIAVTGATGQQGGAVARKLLVEGWQVRALTRDAGKPAAQALAALGAQIMPGDMDNRDELASALRGVYGVFSVQNFWLPTVGFDGEIRQGKNVADAAKAAGVKLLVYSSVGAAHRGMGQKHFESKWIIEQYIHALGVAYTILRPAYFMNNHNWSRPATLNGVLSGMGLSPEKAMQSIAVEDIAVFAVLAFADPEKYLGRTIELAGDELTELQTAQVFSKVIGRPITLAAPGSGPRRRTDEEMKAMFDFFNGEGYSANIPALRRLHPGLLSLEQYLRQNGWENAQPVPASANAGWTR